MAPTSLQYVDIVKSRLFSDSTKNQNLALLEGRSSVMISRRRQHSIRLKFPPSQVSTYKSSQFFTTTINSEETGLNLASQENRYRSSKQVLNLFRRILRTEKHFFQLRLASDHFVLMDDLQIDLKVPPIGMCPVPARIEISEQQIIRNLSGKSLTQTIFQALALIKIQIFNQY